MGNIITGQAVRQVFDLEKIEELRNAIDANDNDITNLQNIKADVIINTVSGDIATFSDGADNMLIKHLVANIEPVQDLHGYDYPWSAGSGKNLLPYPTSAPNVGSQFTQNGVTMTHNADGTLSFVGTATENSYFYINTYTVDHSRDFQFAPNNYILSSDISGAVAGSYRFQMTVYNNGTITRTYADIGSGVDITINTGETEAVYLYVPANKNMEGTVIKPMLRLSTISDATFEPYSNICPITGWTGLTGRRTGSNLLSMTNVYGSSVETTVTKDAQTGSAVVTNTSSQRYTGIFLWYSGLLNLNPFPRGIYTVSFDIAGTVTTSWVAGTRSKSTNIFDSTERANFSAPGHYSFTFDSSMWTEDKYISIARTGNETSDINVTISNLRIVPGTDEGTFEPYVAQNISVNWQSQAGTVYCGYVDVMTGKLTVTDAEIASYNGETLPSTWISDRDVYAAGTTPTIGAQVVYKLAELITYQLTPQKVTTLFGNNVVYTDVGPVTVEYPADTTTVISDIKNSINQLDIEYDSSTNKLFITVDGVRKGEGVDMSGLIN